MPPDAILISVIILSGFYMAWALGANDVANAMGTSVGSGALTLKRAVIIAAVLEFCGAFFFGSHVSETIQKGIVDPNIFVHNPQTLAFGMLAALLAAGTWLQLASYLGLPVSTTHSIVGALVGFGAVVGGMDAVKWETGGFIVSSWVISPLAGGLLGFYFFSVLRNTIFYTYDPVGAAKRLTPLLAFLVVATLSLILVFDGFKNIDHELTFLEGLGISALIGSCASLLSFFLVRRIKVDSRSISTRPPYGPEISYSLSKAKRHLGKVRASAIGDLNYHVSHLLEEINNLETSLKKHIEKEVPASEYSSVEKIFGYLQIMSASLMAFAHGANDVANAIGPLAAAIGVITTGVVSMQTSIPVWTLALGGAGIICGLATWGWRVIETIGKKITELTPTRGFAAEFGAATTILIATRLGMPISTTHTLVGAVIGVGLARGIEALNLGMTRDIVISWIVTVPAGAALAVGFFYGIQFIFS